jgi:hypothetical protein
MSLKHKKRKGKRFEEQIAELLRKYYHLKEKQVYRSLTSGNYRGIEFGDITWSIPIEQFTYIPLIECKNQESWNLEQLITSYQNISFFESDLINKVKQPFKKWFQQIKKEFENLKNEYTSIYGILVRPILVFKKNYSPIYSLTLLDELYINLNNIKSLDFRVTLRNKNNEMYLLTFFEDLLKFEVLKKPFV